MTSEDAIHRQILQDSLRDPDPRQDKTGEFIITIASICLILLLILAFSGNGALSRYFEGRLLSASISETDEVALEQGVLVFKPAVYEELKQIFLDNQEAEYKVCLIGEKIGEEYVVTDLYIPSIYERTVYSVRSAGCNAETIVSLHTHPYEQCVFSEQDLRSAEAFRKVNPEGISAVMCTLDRFTVYR